MIDIQIDDVMSRISLPRIMQQINKKTVGRDPDQLFFVSYLKSPSR